MPRRPTADFCGIDVGAGVAARSSVHSFVSGLAISPLFSNRFHIEPQREGFQVRRMAMFPSADPFFCKRRPLRGEKKEKQKKQK